MRAGNRLMWIAVLAAAAAAAATAAHAQVGAVAGAGARTCMQMSADIAELPNVRRSYVAWMQGFLSAMNASRERRELPLVDLADYEVQWQWLENWCAGHPDNTFASASAALFDDLVRAHAAAP